MAAVVTVALAVGSVGWNWWTHPKAFTDLGDSFIADPQPVADAALSTTVVFPKARGTHETITVNRLSATFSSNTAEADTTFWICHMSAHEDPIGAVSDPGSECSDMEAFAPPMRFDHGVAPDSDYLFVTITPTRPGTAHLTGVEIEYQRSGEHAYQRGAQAIRADRKITAR
ncbi:MAG: hypothetical protein ACI379_00535 [Nocardioides sp.]|uniref:hypothetical protein n=1 Tax=Nocardioides sp. TaxID=35761 RepID=UPI003F09FD28